jgi:hypothetical protein
MSMSTEFMIRSVTETLKNDVLPALEPATWPAGNLRACLALLASIEDRVRNEGSALFACNARLRELLAEIAVGYGMPQDSPMSQGINAVLQRLPVRSKHIEIGELARENQAYQQAVAEIISHAHSRRKEWDSGSYAHLREKIEACVTEIGKLDETLVGSAMNMTPI